jgi:pyruvate,water dikinase
VSLPGLSPLSDARDPRQYGGKAARLARGRRAGLPVPDGVVLGASLVDRIAAGDAHAGDRLAHLFDTLGGALVVRSSAIGEDSSTASFAGQYLTVLNVRGPRALVDAVRDVASSGRSASVISYRRGRGDMEGPGIAVLIQPLIEPDVAGVLFTRDPVTGAGGLLIEAAWGLGESVVAGRVIPDRYRLDAAGGPVERRPGRKDVAVRPREQGGTGEVPVAAHLVTALCLDDAALAALFVLGRRCEDVLGAGQDVEWALVGAQVVLLQSRPITTGVTRG